MKKKFMLLALIALGGMSAFAEESPVLELKQTVVTSDSFGTPVRETAKNMTVINAKEIKEKKKVQKLLLMHLKECQELLLDKWMELLQQ